jgi:microcystin degradation protein MlrC
LAGFPPADLFDCGPSVVVHAYSQELADVRADTVAKEITALEAEFLQPLYNVEEGVRKAIRIAETASRPVILADTQDNPGCGGTAQPVCSRN